MAWLFLRPGASFAGRNPWDTASTSMTGWRFEDPCELWFQKPNLCGTPGGQNCFIGGPGQGSPPALYYEEDPWTPEYREFTDGWPPPDPDVDQAAYDAWIDTVLTYTNPRTFYPFSQWDSCPPAPVQYPATASGRYMFAANAIQNIWDPNSFSYQPRGPNGKPLPRYRILWLRPRTAGVSGWAEVTQVNRVRIDACIGQRQHFATGVSPAKFNEYKNWTSRFAFRFGVYEHNQDWPAVPGSWNPSAITWGDVIQVGSAVGFEVRPYFSEITLGAPISQSDFANRTYILVSYWPLDGLTQNTIDVHRTWCAVDADAGPPGPGEGPGTAVLSVVG